MASSTAKILKLARPVYHYDFDAKVAETGLALSPLSIATLQINLTKLCNQACLHCHVDSSPKRTETMDLRTVKRCLEILATHDEITTLDLTGGAPELNDHFDYLVTEARKLNKHVIVRHNLTVTIDGHPITGKDMGYLPEFFASQRVEVVSSLPYYQQYFTDKQRGRGVFNISMKSMKLLNDVGYGKPGTDLLLNLVYNPVGAFLPAPQAGLEADYHRELRDKFDLYFNSLFTITNMPIHRFARQLKRLGTLPDYMDKLIGAFNPCAATSVMCRTLLSVSHDGRLYDCDFNQMMDMAITVNSEPLTIFNFNKDKLLKRRIAFADHCFGCTAGAGSSCGGTTA